MSGSKIGRYAEITCYWSESWHSARSTLARGSPAEAHQIQLSQQAQYSNFRIMRVDRMVPIARISIKLEIFGFQMQCWVMEKFWISSLGRNLSALGNVFSLRKKSTCECWVIWAGDAHRACRGVYRPSLSTRCTVPIPGGLSAQLVWKDFAGVPRSEPSSGSLPGILHLEHSETASDPLLETMWTMPKVPRLWARTRGRVF